MDLDGDTYVLGKHDRELPRELQEIEDLKLRIGQARLERFDDLGKLTNLVELDVMGYPSSSFTALRSLGRLRRLAIMDFPHATSLDPLRGLTNLEELRLETLPSGDASGKCKIVASFRPLAPLRKLQVLRLAGVRTQDDDLSPLSGLTALRELALGNLFPQQQFAMLAVKLPHVQSSFLAPFLRLHGYPCHRCGGEKVMLSGADVPNPKIVCPTCRRKKFETTVACFDRFKQECEA